MINALPSFTPVFWSGKPNLVGFPANFGRFAVADLPTAPRRGWDRATSTAVLIEDRTNSVQISW
jgi:hypothetical protein